MVSIDAPRDHRIRAAGILDWEPAGAGDRTRRLPAWTREQLLDPALRLVATMPSGGRLEFVSDTTWVEVEVLLTRLALPDQPVRPAVFDLVVDGELRATVPAADGRIIHMDPRRMTMSVERGPATTVTFGDLGSEPKHLEIWLPHGASVELRDLRLEDGASLAPPPASASRQWVHYGSSISHCTEADQPTGVWPVVAARSAGVALTNLGLAGQCQLDQYLARTIRDLPVDLISLKLGINVVNGDTMRERTFLSAVQGFLDTVRDGHPATPLAVITPIICPAAEERPGPTLQDASGRVYTVDRPAELAQGALSLGRIRQLLQEVVEARQKRDANIHLVNGLDLFGPGDLDDLPDGLHPNAAGYRRMGERFHGLAFGPGGFFAA